jgi:hypothetical protein
MYIIYISPHKLFCGLFKQEERANPDNKISGITALWEMFTVEGQRAKYKRQAKSLRQQLKKEVAEHKVS